MKTYEIESVEGVGYLLFERRAGERTKRIGDIFQNIAQARQFIGDADKSIQLVYHCAYEEMINGDTENLDLVTRA